AGDAHETRGRIGFLVERAGLRTVAHDAGGELNCRLRERKACEIVPDEDGDRLAEIERRLAGGNQEVAGKEVRDGYAGGSEIGGEHHPIRLELGIERRKVDAFEDVA